MRSRVCGHGHVRLNLEPDRAFAISTLQRERRPEGLGRVAQLGARPRLVLHWRLSLWKRNPSPNKRGRNGLSLSMLSRRPIQLPLLGRNDCAPGSRRGTIPYTTITKTSGDFTFTCGEGAIPALPGAPAWCATSLGGVRRCAYRAHVSEAMRSVLRPGEASACAPIPPWTGLPRALLSAIAPRASCK
jgi:hypothetical protein